MVIKFVCPNGHPLSAGDEMVGKPGKCPKCQSMFLVPEPLQAPADDGAASKSSVEPGAGTITFLCPNGHKLSGPRTLQGKAGQCPHCGSKFRIPEIEEQQAPAPHVETQPEEEIPVGEIVEDAEDDVADLQDVDVVDDEAPEDDIIEDIELEDADLTPPPPPPDGVHPLAILCQRFARAGNGTIEVAYGDQT
jgi:hypothetical protein